MFYIITILIENGNGAFISRCKLLCKWFPKRPLSIFFFQRMWNWEKFVASFWFENSTNANIWGPQISIKHLQFSYKYLHSFSKLSLTLFSGWFCRVTTARPSSAHPPSSVCKVTLLTPGRWDKLTLLSPVQLSSFLSSHSTVLLSPLFSICRFIFISLFHLLSFFASLFL